MEVGCDGGVVTNGVLVGVVNSESIRGFAGNVGLTSDFSFLMAGSGLVGILGTLVDDGLLLLKTIHLDMPLVLQKLQVRFSLFRKLTPAGIRVVHWRQQHRRGCLR